MDRGRGEPSLPAQLARKRPFSGSSGSSDEGAEDVALLRWASFWRITRRLVAATAVEKICIWSGALLSRARVTLRLLPSSVSQLSRALHVGMSFVGYGPS